MATAYPFDPTGTSAANRIGNEQHVITAANFRDYHYVIPAFAPFFEKNLSLRLQYPNGQIRTLTHGVDYYLSNQFLDASRACAAPIYGSISFLDTDTAGILSLGYNTVGGMWNLSPAEILRILAEEMRNPRITTWEQITYLPTRFPVVDHEWDLIDMVGASSVVTAIDQVRAAILAANGGGLATHINDYANPHRVTKVQVGLGSVENFTIATQQQARDGSSNSFYMTPLRTSDAILAIGGAMVAAHANNTANPHAVTKAQVGLSNVLNYTTATQVQAEAGALDTLYMTPLRVAQAIAAQVGSSYAAHANNKLNPHNVTKDQVGLFNVQNYAVANQEEARAGTANDKYMTPLRTTQLVSEFVTAELDGHATRKDNPHSVTKEQVGLANVQNYAIATAVEAQDGVSNTAYMTPGRTKDAITALIGNAFSQHIADSNNPHGVTRTQIGLGNVQDYPIATQEEAQTATANNRYMTPLRTMQLVTQFVTTELDGHATRIDNPHQVTKAQIGLGSVQNFGIASTNDATTGVSNTVYMTPTVTRDAINAFVGNAFTTHAANLANPHQVTKLQVGVGNVENFTIASQDEARAGLVNDKYMTPLRTSQLVAEYVTTELDGHAARKDNPHVVTKAQVGLGSVENYGIATAAEAAAAAVNNVYMTPQRVRDTINAIGVPVSHLTNYTNPHQVTAAQVGAYSQTQTDTLLAGYVRTNDQWVAGMSKDAFITEVRSGTVSNSDMLGNMSLETLLAKTATIASMDSRDKASVIDPVGTPYRWLLLAEVEQYHSTNSGTASSILTTHPDAYFFMTGGHKQEATPALNAKASSPAYLIHAKNGGAADSHTFDVTRLTGTANSDVAFGYTYDAAASILKVWLKVSCGFNDVNVAHMAELANRIVLDDATNFAEPSGITYVTATGAAGGDQITTLTERVVALEAVINSVSVM